MNALKQLSTITGNVSIENGIATLADGTVLNLVEAFAQQEELLLSMHDVLKPIQNGDIYETCNPYRRPYVVRALNAVKDITGFEGDWKDASPLNPETSQ